MQDSQSAAWLNGRWVTARDLFVPMNDPGFRQGVTAVERLRTYQGRLFQLREHFDRFLQTADALHIAGIPSFDDWSGIAESVLRRNERRSDSLTSAKLGIDVGMTWIATPEPHENQGAPATAPSTLAIHVNAIPHATIEKRVRRGQPLVITNVTQPPSTSWSRQLKVRCRLHYFLADLSAKQIEAEASGVLIDLDGSVTETSIANVAIVSSGIVYAPESSQVLQGVTQGFVEKLAHENDIEWRQKRLSYTDIKEADEVLLMGTDGGIWFASQIFDGRGSGRSNAFGATDHDSVPLPTTRWKRGPVYTALRERFDLATLH